GTMNNFTFGNDRYQYYETICGGAGAGPGFPGTGAVHTHMTNSRLTDPEILELRHPVRVERFGIRRGSGGNGLHTGGDGVIRRLRFGEPVTVAVMSNRRRIPPFGLAGGEPGRPGRNIIVAPDGTAQDMPGTFVAELGPGDVLEVRTPGGGGYGSPDKGRSG
ncbi:MAG: hydantoinase B/oxoprolinase family protein, partial [Anaerolineae bacterium]